LSVKVIKLCNLLTPQAAPNLYSCCSSAECKRRYFEEYG